MSERQQGLILVILSSIAYAFMPIFARRIYMLSPNLQATDVSIWRFVLAVPIIWLAVVLRQRQSKRKVPKQPLPHRWLPVLGVLYAISTLTAFAALESISASLYVVLFFTYPAMVALLSLFFGQRLSRYGWLALAITLIGIFLTVPDVSQLAGGNAIGVAFALLNALGVAVYFMLNGYALRNVADVSTCIAWIITWTLIVLLLSVPVLGLKIPQNFETWLTIAALSLFSTAFPIFIVALAIQKIGATQTSIISSIEPVIAMLLAILLLGEVIHPGQWVGAILIMFGVLLLQLPSKKKLAKSNST